MKRWFWCGWKCPWEGKLGYGVRDLVCTHLSIILWEEEQEVVALV